MCLLEKFSLNDLLNTRQMTDFPTLSYTTPCQIPTILYSQTGKRHFSWAKTGLPLRLILSLSLATFILSLTFVSACLAHFSQQQEVLENFPWSTNSTSIVQLTTNPALELKFSRK